MRDLCDHRFVQSARCRCRIAIDWAETFAGVFVFFVEPHPNLQIFTAFIDGSFVSKVFFLIAIRYTRVTIVFSSHSFVQLHGKNTAKTRAAIAV